MILRYCCCPARTAELTGAHLYIFTYPPIPQMQRYKSSKNTMYILYVKEHHIFCFRACLASETKLVKQSVLFFNSQNLCEWCLDEFLTESWHIKTHDMDSLLVWEGEERDQHRVLMDLELLNCQWTRKQKHINPALKLPCWSTKADDDSPEQHCWLYAAAVSYKQNQQLHFWLLQSIF